MTDRSAAADLRILKEIAEALNGTSDVEQALQTTLQRVADLLGLDTGWIWLTDPTTGQFYSAVVQHLPPFLREPVRMTGRSCWCLQAYREGSLTAGNIDVMECSRLRAAGVPCEAGADGADGAGGGNGGRSPKRSGTGTRGLRYHASVPLYFGTRPLGIMNVAAPAWRKLTRRELDLLSTIASQVGVAIERGRLACEGVQVARMEERAHLAREIHDTLAQRLTAIGLHIEAALGELPHAPRAAHEALAPEEPAIVQMRRALALARESLDDVRGSMRTLREPSLGQPLSEALLALAHAFTTDTGVRVRVRRAGQATLPAAAEEQLYRIASEALLNVRRHARATAVELTLHGTRRLIRLEITDNGAGFNARARTTGFGIVGMRERAGALGGTLRLVSAAGRGTQVIVAVPQIAPSNGAQPDGAQPNGASSNGGAAKRAVRKRAFR